MQWVMPGAWHTRNGVKMMVMRMIARIANKHLCNIQEAWEAASSTMLKILHQHKYLNLQEEKTVLATMAHFPFCMRTRKHTGDSDPLAGNTPEPRDSSVKLCRLRKAPRNSKEIDKGSAGSCWSRDGLLMLGSCKCLIFLCFI